VTAGSWLKYSPRHRPGEEPVRVVVFGAEGRLGASAVDELLRRHHTVRAVIRPGKRRAPVEKRVTTVVADVTDAEEVADAVRGADAVISAVGPGAEGSPQVITTAARSLIEGMRSAGVARLVVVGGAGSLEVRPGLDLLDTPDFPPAWRGAALAHREALGVFRDERDLEWTVVSPAANVTSGARTGHYRAGGDGLLVDAKGQSEISVADLAVALVDEVETPRHIRRRFTVANA
jgi:uncharacterized protein